MTTPFELLYGVKARFPSFPNPNPDIQKLHYGESFASERLQILQHAWQLANSHAAQNSENYKDQFDKNAVPHSYKVGDLVLYSEYNFLGKNKKLAPKFLGPATIIDINDTNAKIKCSNNKIKSLNVSHLKHFVLESAKQKLHHRPDDDLFP